MTSAGQTTSFVSPEVNGANRVCWDYFRLVRDPPGIGWKRHGGNFPDPKLTRSARFITVCLTATIANRGGVVVDAPLQ
jgi:hypothetical protein